MTHPTFYDPDLDNVPPDRGMTLRGAEAHHAIRVMRIKPGEIIDVVNGRGLRFRGNVTNVKDNELTLEQVLIQQEPLPNPRLMLVQALAKGGRDEAALEASVELGVDSITAWQASRSISQWRGDKKDKGVQRWQKVAISAMKQSRRAYLPAVSGVSGGKALTRYLPTPCRTLVLHEQATEKISDIPLPSTGWVAVVVGPEGGITDEEVTAFQTQVQAVPVRLGEEILRTSTAGPAALTALNLRLGRW